MAKTKATNDVDDILGILNEDSDLETFANSDNGSIKNWIPTLIPEFDYNLVAGIPASGQVSEVAGKPGSGKTTLMGRLMSNALKMGVVPVYFDLEASLDSDRLEHLDVDPHKVNLLKATRLPDGTIKPISIEDVGDKIIDTLAKVHSAHPNQLLFFIWDSIAMSKATMELSGKDLEQQFVGQKAKALASVGQAIQINLAKNNGFLVSTNQARDDFGAANPKYAQLKTTGGNAWEHLLSTRITLQPAGKLKENSSSTQAMGNVVRVKVPKSKVGDNYDSNFTIDLIGKYGYDLEWNLLQEGQDLGLLTKGQWIKYADANGEEHKYQGKAGFVSAMKDPANADVKKEIYFNVLIHYFPYCYPPLFNINAFLHVNDFSFLEGLRAYYIGKQKNLPPLQQDFNYKTFMDLYQNNPKLIPDDVKDEVKEALASDTKEA